MGIFEMSLDKLYEYQGRNECPADIDAYWDRAIAEMESLGTGCELIPASFQVDGVECFEMYFYGIGNARIHCRFVRPAKRNGKIPAVCIYHGYAGNCGSFSNLLRWPSMGFAAVVMSCRGQGGLSEDIIPVKGNTLHGHIIRGLDDPDPDKLYYRNVFLDAAQLVRIIMAMDEIDETRVAASGGSQGGGLTLACAALTPNLNRAAPYCPFLCDYRRVWEMDLDLNAYAELREYFRHSDPLHVHESETFTKLGYVDNQHIAKRIKARIKMFTGLMDNVCPPSTQFAVYNKITAPKEIVLYPDYAHEIFPDCDDMIMTFMAEMR